MGLLALDRVIFRGQLPTRAMPLQPGWEFLQRTYEVQEQQSEGELGADSGGSLVGGSYGRDPPGLAGSSGGGGDGRPVQPLPDIRAMAAATAAMAAGAVLSGGRSQRMGDAGGQVSPGGSGGGCSGGGGAGSLGSSLRSELQRRLEGMVWTRHTAPAEWTWSGLVLPTRVT